MVIGGEKSQELEKWIEEEKFEEREQKDRFFAKRLGTSVTNSVTFFG